MNLEQHCRESVGMIAALGELFAVAAPGDEHQHRCLELLTRQLHWTMVWLVAEADHGPRNGGHACPLITPNPPARVGNCRKISSYTCDFAVVDSVKK